MLKTVVLLHNYVEIWYICFQYLFEMEQHLFEIENINIINILSFINSIYCNIWSI